MNGLVLVLVVILKPRTKSDAEPEEHSSCDDARDNPT